MIELAPGNPLLEEALPEEPLPLFLQWLNEAREKALYLPEAMALATASRRGEPSLRMVLLKEASAEGLLFFTSSMSRKAREMEENPRAALLFYWGALHRQVRVEGSVKPVKEEVARQYFLSRPEASRIATWISAQSQRVSSRAELEKAFLRFQQEHPEKMDQCPPHWVGYRVQPHYWEFWQGHPDRLHDRIAYRRTAEQQWERFRLAP